MTPPRKSPARKPAKTASTGKKPAKAAAPGKKRTGRRRKKAPGLSLPILAAFLAGCLMATLLYWGAPSSLRDEGQEPGRAAQTVVTGKASSGADKTSPGGGKTQGAAVTKGETPRAAVAGKAVTTEGANPAETVPEQGAGAPGLSAQTQSEVAKALMDLQNFPYEETFVASLEERIRQSDYAVVQAVLVAGLPLTALRQVDQLNRTSGGEPYQMRRLRVYVQGQAESFENSLRDTLATWADGASLQKFDEGRLGVFLGAVQTHELTLVTSGDAAPHMAGKVPPDFPQRTRGVGEPAQLVIVIDDLGNSISVVRELLGLSVPVTFAFWPDSTHGAEGARLAHRSGREILVHQPMEPIGYPKVQPGPRTLFARMDAARIRREVEVSLGKIPYAVGLNNHMGSRFTQSREGARAVAETVGRRGLFLLDSVTHNRSVLYAEGRNAGVRSFRRNVFLDVTPSRSAVLKELHRAERIALLTGQAIAIGHPLPETLAALKEWDGKRNMEVRVVRLQDLVP